MVREQSLICQVIGEMVQLKELRRQSMFLPSSRTTIASSIGSIAMIVIGILCLNKSQTVTYTPAPVNNSKPNIATVNALGRLERKDDIIKVGRFSNGISGTKVAKLFVQQGDRVEEGQLIAILENRHRLQASLNEAQKKVKVSKSRLAQVEVVTKKRETVALQATVNRLQTGLKGENELEKTTNRLESKLKGQNQALKATINRQKTEQDNVFADLKHYKNLFKDGVITEQELDSGRLKVKNFTEQVIESRANQNTKISTLKQEIFEATANRDTKIAILQQQINEAKGNLKKTLEVTPTDVAEAQAEVDSALATVERLKAELNSAYIRAPKAGQILSIKTHPGEIVSNGGIVELRQ